MKTCRIIFVLSFSIFCSVLSFGQQSANLNRAPAADAASLPAANAPAQAPAQATIPRLIKFNGTLRDLSGKPLSGPVDVTFSLYGDESGGSALWFETQTVQADSRGNYTVLLGAMSPAGVPMELFTSGEAHWLGVQVSNLPEQSRILLVSVPYAMKAGDAETLGGRPASAYLLTSQADAHAANAASLSSMITKGSTTTTSESPVTNTITSSYIPVYTDSIGTTANSILFQSGTKIGINTNSPGFNLDLNGNVFIVGTKTALAGNGGTMRFRDDTGTQRWLFGIPGSAGSQDFQMYNYSNGHAPIFVQNGAASYSLYLAGTGNVGVGTSSPAQKLSVAGIIQSTSGGFKFPDGSTQTTAATGGGGSGTVTSVGTGSGLTGGPITTSGTISVAAGGVTNAMLANSGVTINTNSGLTGGGAVSLGGNLTLGISSTSCSAGQAVTALPGPGCQPFATFGSNGFLASQSITVSSADGLDVTNTGNGYGILAISSADSSGGAAGYFQNINGGRILEANDGNNDVFRVDTKGVKIQSTVNQIPNDPSTSTVLYDLITVNTSTGNAVLAGPGWSRQGVGALGVVVANAGTSAQFPEAVVAFYGDAQCNFDNTAVSFDYIQISPTTAGLCHDAGSKLPALGQVIGVVTDTGTSPPSVFLLGPGIVPGSGVFVSNANCASGASPAVCGNAKAGSVALPAGGTTLVVDTGSVNANSQIMLQEDSSLGSLLSATCNTTAGRTYMVTARTAGTSFTITASGAPATNPACLSYVIIN